MQVSLNPECRGKRESEVKLTLARRLRRAVFNLRNLHLTFEPPRKRIDETCKAEQCGNAKRTCNQRCDQHLSPRI
jgi:hypothetical protein